MTFFYTDRSGVIQPPTEMIPPSAVGNKHRNPQSDITQKGRDPGILGSKWNVSIKHFSLRVQGITGIGYGKSVRAGGDESKAL